MARASVIVLIVDALLFLKIFFQLQTTFLYFTVHEIVSGITSRSGKKSYKCHYRPVFLNLFRAVAHFKDQQLLAAHFNEEFNAIMSMSLGQA